MAQNGNECANIGQGADLRLAQELIVQRLHVGIPIGTCEQSRQESTRARAVPSAKERREFEWKIEIIEIAIKWKSHERISVGEFV